MSEGAPCAVCESNAGRRRISPGPPVHVGDAWVVEHAYPTSLPGWLVIVLRRHVEALHELTNDEAVELGILQRAVCQALAEVTDCAKEYAVCFGEAEGFAHLHVHVVPRAPDLDASLRGGGIFHHVRDPSEPVDPAQVASLCRTLAPLVAARVSQPVSSARSVEAGAAGPVVRRLAAHEWDAYRDLRLRALADAPDAFGSTLEWERERADAEWRGRVEAAVASELELPLVIVDEDGFAGLAWGRIPEDDPASAYVFQMWVAPERRGRGHARELLGRLVEWAREAGARHVLLDVTVGQTPAERLYASLGFEPAGETRPLRPGSGLAVQPMRLALG